MKENPFGWWMTILPKMGHGKGDIMSNVLKCKQNNKGNEMADNE